MRLAVACVVSSLALLVSAEAALASTVTMPRSVSLMSNGELSVPFLVDCSPPMPDFPILVGVSVVLSAHQSTAVGEAIGSSAVSAVSLPGCDSPPGINFLEIPPDPSGAPFSSGPVDLTGSVAVLWAAPPNAICPCFVEAVPVSPTTALAEPGGTQPPNVPPPFPTE